MYFDFEDDHPDITPVGRAISWREGVLLSIIVHLLAILGVVMMPELPGAEAARLRVQEQIAAEQQRQRDAARFVFVQPRIDEPAPVPPMPRADLSDRDRIARAPERSPNPANELPFSRGNTRERVEVSGTPTTPQPEVAPPPQPPAPAGTNDPGDGEGARGAPPLGGNGLALPAPPDTAGRGETGRGTGSDGVGVLGRALQDLRRYVQPEQFDNQGGGGGAYGPSIQFDTKGVEFGPWIRRFVLQIKRNWFIPYAAMANRGHVVVTFYVMKDGRIEELSVAGPCPVEAFNVSSYNAMAASDPTYPLPAEYPADRAFFTVTFYYNENPPIR
ncbi:MAG: energy transducer TonB [Vicinamibacterales bacterium]